MLIKKLLIGLMPLIMLNVAVMAEDVLIYKTDKGYIILTTEKCKDSDSTYRFKAFSEALKQHEGCFFVTANQFVVVQRDIDNLVFAIPAKMFVPITGV